MPNSNPFTSTTACSSAPAPGCARSRPAHGRSGTDTGSWITLAKFKSVYRQVIPAAILINLFALAGPLFTINVYDRVVPNNAVETLWVLAVGMLIVYMFDFILKVLRA